MANGFVVVDKETWMQAEQAERDRMIYNTLRSLDARLKTLERWAWIRTGSQFFGAMIGGALVVLFAMKCGVKL